MSWSQAPRNQVAQPRLREIHAPASNPLRSLSPQMRVMQFQTPKDAGAYTGPLKVTRNTWSESVGDQSRQAYQQACDDAQEVRLNARAKSQKGSIVLGESEDAFAAPATKLTETDAGVPAGFRPGNRDNEYMQANHTRRAPVPTTVGGEPNPPWGPDKSVEPIRRTVAAVEEEKHRAEMEAFNKQRDLEIAAEREAYLAANARRIAAEQALAQSRAAPPTYAPEAQVPETNAAPEYGWEHGHLPTDPLGQRESSSQGGSGYPLQPNRQPLNDSLKIGMSRSQAQEITAIRQARHAEDAPAAGGIKPDSGMDIFGRPRHGGSSNGTSPAVAAANFESAAGGMLRRDTDGVSSVATDRGQPAGHPEPKRPSTDVFGNTVVDRSLAPAGPPVPRDIFGNQIMYPAKHKVDNSARGKNQDIFGNAMNAAAPRVSPQDLKPGQSFDVFGNVVSQREAPPIENYTNSKLKFVDPSIPPAMESFNGGSPPTCMPPVNTQMERDLLPVVHPLPGPKGTRCTFTQGY